MPQPFIFGDTEFRPVEGGRRLLSDEVNGLDTMRDTYRGAVSKLDRFAAKFKKGDAAPGGSTMWFVGADVVTVGKWATFVAVYQGSSTGSERPPVITYSIREESATLPTDEPEVDPPVDVLYRSQVVTARYTAIGSTPITPKYSGLLPSTLRASPYSLSPPASLLVGELRWEYEFRNRHFEVTTLIEGKLHTVVEAWALQVVDPGEKRKIGRKGAV